MAFPGVLFAGGYENDSTLFDPLFQGRGYAQFTFTTSVPLHTPPPIMIGELSYGFSGRFTGGVLAGTTGVVGFYGVKVNYLMYSGKKFRLHFRMPVVYYPKRSGKFLFDRRNITIEPWMLSLASVSGEWRTKKNIRYLFGIGAVETHCAASMWGVLHKWGILRKAHGHALTEIHETSPSMLGVFNTFHAGILVPLGKKWIFGSEIVMVMNGFNFSQKNEFRGGFPVNPLFQLYYQI